MFGRSRRAAGDVAARSNDRPGGRRSATPIVLSLLLLLAAAGGVAWLHFTNRLAPLVAGGPHIEVELPSAISAAESGAPEADAADAEPAPAEHGPAGEAEMETDTPAAVDTAEAPHDTESSPPGADAELTLDTGTPAPDAVPPVDDVAPDGAAGHAAPATPASEPVTSDEPPPPEAPAHGAADPESAHGETPAATEPAHEPAPEASAPPPPAPPAPEVAAELAAETPGQAAAEDGTHDAPAAPPAVPEADAAHAAAADAAHGPTQPEAAQAEAADAGHGVAEGQGADSTQIAAATVPPGVVPAWRQFARPFPSSETRPRIAVVVAGLGLSEAATTAAIQQLPGEITLSFSPYSNRIAEWVAMAQAAGHEVMIDLPMEPASFPRDDPGPQALLTSLSDGTNAARLEWILGRTDSYVGVASYMGSRFTTSSDHMRPVLEVLARRGLLFLDSRAAADSLGAKLATELGVNHAINDRFLDHEASRVAIDGRLQQIERIARTKGVAVAMGYAYPVTVERLTQWTKSLTGKGLVLAPISAVADMQEDR